MYGTPSGTATTVGCFLPVNIMNRSDLSTGCKLVLGTLCALSRSHGFCWSSQQYLADALGMSRRSIQYHLKELAEAQLIRIENVRAGSTLRYHPQVPFPKVDSSSGMPVPEKACAKFAQGGTQKATSGCANFAHNIRDINIYKKDPPLPPQSGKGNASRFTPEKKTEEDFGRLWEAWPVKQSEHDARSWFRRLRRMGVLPVVETLLSAVQNLKEHDCRWKRGYAPNLGNWLRGRRWNDLPYQEPVPSASGATQPLCSSEVPTSPATSARITSTMRSVEVKHSSPPLVAADVLAELVSRWPKEGKRGQGNASRGAWAFLTGKQKISPNLILQCALAYLRETDIPMRLELWLWRFRELYNARSNTCIEIPGGNAARLQAA